MPAPLTWTLGLAAGSSLAWLAASMPATGGIGSEPRARLAARYFGALVVGPAAAVLELASAPWASFYLGDPPSAIGLLVCIGAAFMPAVGERFARLRLDRGDARSPLAVSIGGAVGTLLVGAVAWSRIEVVTTQTAYEQGLGGSALFAHPAGFALVLAALGLVAGYVFAVRALAVPTADVLPREGGPRDARAGRSRTGPWRSS